MQWALDYEENWVFIPQTSHVALGMPFYLDVTEYPNLESEVDTMYLYIVLSRILRFLSMMDRIYDSGPMMSVP